MAQVLATDTDTRQAGKEFAVSSALFPTVDLSLSMLKPGVGTPKL